MKNNIDIKRGLDLAIDGGLAEAAPEAVAPVLTAVIPDDFPGFVPKLDVREGDAVDCGAPIMHSKDCEAIRLCAPVAATVTAVVRGARRKIERVELTPVAGGGVVRTQVDPSDPESIKKALMASGLWAEMRQRPFDIVPKADATPRDIFVTAFDSAPLAPDLTLLVAGKQAEIDAGLAALAKLTTGKVYVSTRPEAPLSVNSPAVHITVSGPHPAGNPGVQAANLAPVNKGETIWTLDIVTAARIGELMLTGSRSFSTLVAVVGPEVEKPYLAQTVECASVAPLLKGHVKEDGSHHRIIAGNVLTGVKTSADGFLHFPYRQVTVIAEGDDVDEFMGWASMSPSKMSVSRTFPLSRLRRAFSPDARLLGGRRAMIVSGLYDKVLPMDIMAEYLLKAIGARDIDNMERLGIYEIAPEDMALCEYVDPSKTEIQKAVREGLDWLRKETE